MTERGAYSPKEAAEWLGISEASIYRLMERGDLPYVKLLQKGRRISTRALEELVNPSSTRPHLSSDSASITGAG